MLGHKEFRFLLPLVPIAMVYAGAALSASTVRLRPRNPDTETLNVDTETLKKMIPKSSTK